MLNYSFTFTIPAFKKVYWNAKRRPYGSLSPNQQYHFLEDIMMKIINPLNYIFIDWVYEKHDDGRLHIHGYVNLDEEHNAEIYKLRDAFYSYNDKINIKISSYLKLSDIQETKTNINFWIAYMDKHQNDIVFKNGYAQQQDLIQNLDAGIVKIIDNKRYRRPDNFFLIPRFNSLDIPIYETDTDNELSVEI